MSHTLPISLCLFTSTKGHFGCRTLYRATLDYLDRQIPLSEFGCRYGHIKVSPGDEVVADEIESNLRARDFVVERTVGSWSRGTSHQQAYLGDISTASRNRALQCHPFVLIQEDDSIMQCEQDGLPRCLHRMTKFLDDPEVVSTRFLRAGDMNTSPVISLEADHFYSPDYNLQPSILRSRDFHSANLIIEKNWSQLGHLQCELVLRIALDQLSRSVRRHVVWHPDYAATVHLGVPDYDKVAAAHNLTSSLL